MDIMTHPQSKDSTMDRPTRRAPNVVKTAAENMAYEIVKRWDHEGTVEEWVELLTKRDILARDYDGYKLARELEREYIDPDSELVEVLDDTLHYIDSAHNEAIEQWVRLMEIRPTYKEGDLVSWNSRGEVKTGKIRTITQERAQYVIAPEDEPIFQNGGGYLVDYENVRDPVLKAED